jgi:ABC-type amino acid transport substrate-binding protein
MRRSASIAVIFALICIAATTVLAASPDGSLSRVKGAGALTVCAVDNLLPYSSSDPKHPGFEVEIAQAVAKGLGVSLAHHWSSWDGLIPALTSKRCDVIIDGMFITADRAKVVAFSRPYYSSGETILVRKDNNAVKGLADLKGKKIGVLTGSVTVGLLRDKGLGSEEVLYPDQNTVMLELSNGRVDAAYLEAPSAAWALQKDSSLNAKIVTSYVPDERFNAAVVLRKDDKALLSAVNGVVGKLVQQGTIAKILQRYGIPFWPAK